MNEKLRNHFELLFANAPKTRKAFELKEELLTNSEERYKDLTSSGITPEDAYMNVVNSIGNVKELFKGLEEMSIDDEKEATEKTKKIAMTKTVAVGLYIFSVIVFFSFGMMDDYISTNMDLAFVGFIAMLIIAIVPTCMLVYISNITPTYNKRDDSVVENFKEWNVETRKLKAIKDAVICVLWTLIILIYFAVSFITFYWSVTWLIFLVGICVHAVVELLFKMKELK